MWIWLQALGWFLWLTFRPASRTKGWFDWLGLLSITGVVIYLVGLTAFGKWLGGSTMVPGSGENGIAGWAFTIALPAVGVAILFLVAGVRLTTRMIDLESPILRVRRAAILPHYIRGFTNLLHQVRYRSAPTSDQDDRLEALTRATEAQLKKWNRPDLVEIFLTDLPDGPSPGDWSLTRGNMDFVLDAANRAHSLNVVLQHL